MTPSEKNIVKSLVAVAWADGKMAAPETSVIEGLLCGFDASEAEEREILDYARSRRTLTTDIPLADLTGDDREILLANAALLTHADGEQSEHEAALLDQLASILGFSDAEKQEILASVADGAMRLGSGALDEA